MFCYQRSFGSSTEVVSQEQFRALITAPETIKKVKEAREALTRGDKKTYDKKKKGLPLMVFIGTFEESVNSKGNKGCWRTQKHVNLNGLVVADYDHLEGDVRQLWEEAYACLSDEDKARIMLVFVTPSGQGLKVVFTADVNIGNLFDNISDMSDKLGFEADKSGKDGCRGAFMTTENDIISINEKLFTYENKDFGEKYDAEYRAGNSRPTPKPLPVMEGSGQTQAQELSAPSLQGWQGESLPCFKGRPYSEIIDEWWKRNGGVPQEGERNVKLYQLAVNLRAICDNKKEVLLQIMPRLGLDEQELHAIVESACKEPPKGVSKQLKEILDTQGRKVSTPLPDREGMGESLLAWGEQIEAMFDDFPILRDICKGLKRNQYPAALFVAGAFEMTLMTRCTYRFYHRPEELRRLNSSTLIIGDPASGKSFATRLFKILASPIVEADQAGRDAINAYRELMRTKGANKEKPKKPKVVVRVHPARTSNAQFIQDMVNAVEVVDGKEMHLHMLTFDTELDNTVSVQKGGSWIDKFSMELKAFHNEEDGQAYSNNESILQDFNVFWNYVYTGTPIALKKKVNEQNFGSGLATRLTCIPLPATNFEMMSRESTVDYESDERLREWAKKLDRMKGELTIQKIVDELYDWTARRMMDAAENDSKADEMLLKRCAYHGINFSAPFIVMRHWDKMKQDGDYWCGEFETDEVDWKLAELIVNIQYACQRHYFGAMAEAYFDNKLRDASVNVRRKEKTREGFERLPEEFTTEDVMRCFELKSEGAARSRAKRLIDDHLIEKIGDIKTGKAYMSQYHKIGIMA